ncbi:MAG: DUF4956 domain-containing protein [Saprospiraceae bacterium]
MFDFSFITTNTENPTFLTILFTVMFSFLMSVMIAFTYEKTSRQVARPDNYIQALILIAIVAATIMQAIGDSLARGLGMLGALSIIRFRTTLRNPRNIVFMFSSLAAGIACGVGGYVIAFVGTLSLCVSTFLLRLTPFSKQQNLIGTLTLELPNNSTIQDQVKTILKKHCVKYSVQSYRVFNSEAKAHLLECRYQLKLKDEMKGASLANELKALEEVKSIRLAFKDTEDII